MGSATSNPSDWFITRDMGDELLVYDLRSQRTTSLNPFAAAVWRRVQEQADISHVRAALQGEGFNTADDRTIELASDMLAQAGLLESPLKAKSAKPPSPGRRGLLRALFTGGALATAAAVTPAVVTIVAPTPAHASSSGCGICMPPTPYCNWEEECVQCLNYENCVSIGKSFCSNFECF